MSSPPPAQRHTTVFNALGSYADRIKDSNGNEEARAEVPTKDIPAKPTQSVRAKQPVTISKPSVPPQNTSVFPPSNDLEDDGPWETVQTSRHNKPKQEERRGGASSSRNWRERGPSKEQQNASSSDDKREITTKSTKKKLISGTEKPVTAKPASGNTSGIGSKSVWGSQTSHAQQPTSAQGNVTSTPDSSSSTIVQTPLSFSNTHSHTTPSSPSLNGTTITNNASPQLSADTTSSTAVMSMPDHDEPTWPAKPREIRPALPPAVNPWDERKKRLTPANSTNSINASISAVQPSPSSAGAALQFGTLSPNEPVAEDPVSSGNAATGDNGKVNNNKKKKKSGQVPAPVDAIMWPDVAQAAEATKAEEDKKDRNKEKKDSETSTAIDEAPQTGKKQKWTAIPADELQAAADEAAETTRRQAAARKKQMRAESSTSPSKSKSRKSSTDAKRGRSGSSGIRLPPMPAGSAKAPSNNFRPVFGTAPQISDSASSAGEINTSISAPLSRQTSRQTQLSPRLSRTQLPSPASQHTLLDNATMRIGRGPMGQSPNPLATQSVNPISSFGNNPASGSNARPPRGRDGRGSFSSRTPGAFRPPHNPNRRRGFASPPQMMNALPADNLYARGYGMGYGFVPQPMGPVSYPQQNGMMDWNAQYAQQFAGRGNMPPPPMPQTNVQNLDPLRWYVLGQVEYYFSMQNLAMDFFLRQQMDSEGWIDIPMIASFNRIRTLTTDVPLVKEVMEISMLLEVRGDKVRLANGESKKWVLPEAKPSNVTPNLSTTDAGTEMKSPTNAELTLGMNGLGIQDGPASTGANGSIEVENALMKRVPPTSTSSMPNGDAGEDKNSDSALENRTSEAKGVDQSKAQT